MHIMKIKKLASRGDTIVEVMIVLAVLGLAMSICYATASRSLVNARQAQENAEASELVSSQIEQLRANSLLPTSDGNSPYNSTVNNTAKAFCFAGSDMKDFSINAANLANFSSYSRVECIKDGRYHLAIKRAIGTNNFTVTAYWDSVSGEGQDSVTMNYKLPKEPS